MQLRYVFFFLIIMNQIKSGLFLLGEMVSDLFIFVDFNLGGQEQQQKAFEMKDFFGALLSIAAIIYAQQLMGLHVISLASWMTRQAEG